jgi:hypothetical protein
LTNAEVLPAWLEVWSFLQDHFQVATHGPRLSTVTQLTARMHFIAKFSSENVAVWENITRECAAHHETLDSIAWLCLRSIRNVAHPLAQRSRYQAGQSTTIRFRSVFTDFAGRSRRRDDSRPFPACAPKTGCPVPVGKHHCCGRPAERRACWFR